MDYSRSGFPVHHQLPELAQIYVHQVGDAIQPFHPLSPLLLLPAIFPSIRTFSNESVLCTRWPKYWSFSFSTSPSNEYSGLISFRMDWLQSKDTQESSSAPQFESISSSLFSLLCGKSEVYDLWSVQSSCSVMSNSLWSLDCSMPGFPVHHQLPELAQTPVHWVGDAIQPSHPLPSPSPPAPKSLPESGFFPMSQLFTWGGQSIRVSASASVLPMDIQDWFPLVLTGWISLQSRDSHESSPTPQFKSINSSALSFLHSPTFTSIHDYWKNHSLDYI